jgi:hypothetical protein
MSTAGNRTPDETEELDAILHQLRMAFVGFSVDNVHARSGEQNGRTHHAPQKYPSLVTCISNRVTTPGF